MFQNITKSVVAELVVGKSDSRKLRVVFINTADVAGGAAIAATRIADALVKYHGAEVLFLCDEKFSARKNVVRTRPKPLWFLEKSFNRIMCLLGAQYLWIPFSSAKIIECVKAFKPDLIHFHNLHGGYIDFKTMRELAGLAPIVWTLHDEWLLTAHCACFGTCRKWRDVCDICPDHSAYPCLTRFFSYHQRKKREFLEAAKPLLVTPSRWLKDLAEQSSNAKMCDVVEISNPISFEKYKFIPGARAEFGFGECDRVVLFSAAKFSDLIKGGDMLPELLKLLDERTEGGLHVIFVGRMNERFDDRFQRLRLHFAGSVPVEKVPFFYSLADLFVMLSREDNQPLTAIEALSCGVPICAFAVGGIPELAVPGETGSLIEPFDIGAMADEILKLLNDEKRLKKYSENALELVRNRCDERVVAEKYYQAYLRKINSK